MVSNNYLRALFTHSNIHAPPNAPNLYLKTPAEPTFLNTPSIRQTAEFRSSIQAVKEDGDLAYEQALGLRARTFLKNDPHTKELSSEDRSFLEGVAATISSVSLRNPRVFESSSLYTRALIESDVNRNIVNKAVFRTCQVGPTIDDVQRPCQFYVTKPGEKLVALKPGQVCFEIGVSLYLQLNTLTLQVIGNPEELKSERKTQNITKRECSFLKIVRIFQFSWSLVCLINCVLFLLNFGAVGSKIREKNFLRKYLYLREFCAVAYIIYNMIYDILHIK